MKKSIALVLVLFWLAGCASTGTHSNNYGQKILVHHENTLKQEILDWLKLGVKIGAQALIYQKIAKGLSDIDMTPAVTIDISDVFLP